MVGERLVAALRAHDIPFVSVSIGRENDRATWAIQYDPQATPQNIEDGAALLATFDPNAADVVAALDTATAEAGLDTRWSKAQILWMLRLTLGREPSAEEQDEARASLVQAYKDVS